MTWLRGKYGFGVAALLSAMFVANFSVAQVEVEEEPASPGIVFLKPPSSPILGVQSNKPDVLSIIENNDIRALINAAEFSFARRGLGNVYRTRLIGVNLQLPNQIMRDLELDPSTFWIVDNVAIDTEITLSEPWSRAAYDAGTLRITKIDVAEVTLDWAGVAFTGGGVLTVDALGLVSGKIDLRVTSWNPDISLTERLPQAETSELDSLLQVVLVGGELTVPVNFDHGILKIGILPVGNVPALLP